MKARKHILLWPLSSIAVFFSACQQPVEPEATGDETSRLSVYVVNYPLQYFAERIGGDRVDVFFPAPRDVDPAEWRPDDETILRYQKAELIFLNGAGYERWVRHASLPVATQIDTSRNVQDRLLEVPDAITHSHGPGGHTHSHAGTAFTTWLDPMLAIEHARVVTEVLSKRLPAGKDEFEGRFKALAADFVALDRAIAETVSADPDKLLLASHPVYQYLEARYGLKLESLHWEPDEMPGAGEWEAFDERLGKHPAKWILWEDEPLPEIVERLEERGVASIVYHPCAQPPEEGDLLSVMRQNAENLRAIFE